MSTFVSGSLVLGAAGLLKGKRATTHWLSHPMLSAFQAIPVEERIVRDGNLFTAGGVTSGIDFALSIVSEIAGRAVAEKIQLMIEYNPTPPFNSGSPAVAPPEIIAAVRRERQSSQSRRQGLIEKISRGF